MGSRGGRRRPERWCVQPLTPLMEGPDLERQDHELVGYKKEISSWEVIREWFRVQRNIPHLGSTGSGNGGFSFIMPLKPKRQDLRLLLGVLGCPLAPIPLPTSTFSNNLLHLHSPHIIKHIPIENSRAHYIIQQYLAATGCLKHQQHNGTNTIHKTNMYTTGVVKMICCETEISCGTGKGSVKTIGTTRSSGENGCFELWQMTPGMWSLELVLGNNSGGGGHNNKLIAGSNGHIVWRHTPWLGTHAAKGPLRPLRRLIQGLDPKSTARLFGEAQCLGEKRIGEEDCFVLKVTADKAALKERNEGAAEVIRHILYGYFSQKTGHLIYLEDSHLTRVSAAADPTADATSVNNFSTEEETAVYWETTIGSSIGDYREVDGVLIAHQGRTIATVFRFGESSLQHSRTRMEEIWRIDDVVFNVPGLSLDSFIPPADIFHSPTDTP